MDRHETYHQTHAIWTIFPAPAVIVVCAVVLLCIILLGVAVEIASYPGATFGLGILMLLLLAIIVGGTEEKGKKRG